LISTFARVVWQAVWCVIGVPEPMPHHICLLRGGEAFKLSGGDFLLVVGRE
jgi:hypothetical protein